MIKHTLFAAAMFAATCALLPAGEAQAMPVAPVAAVATDDGAMVPEQARWRHGNRGRHYGWTRGRHYGWSGGRGYGGGRGRGHGRGD